MYFPVGTPLEFVGENIENYQNHSRQKTIKQNNKNTKTSSQNSLLSWIMNPNFGLTPELWFAELEKVTVPLLISGIPMGMD